MLNDAFGDAAQEHVREAAAPVRSHHDQLRAGLRGASDDLVLGPAESVVLSHGIPARAMRVSSARKPSSARSITFFMSIGIAATSTGGGRTYVASTATCTKSTVAPAS